MKIHCSKEDLVQSVQTIQSALSSRTTLPILLNFLMETENSKVKVVGTDLEMGVKHYMGAEIETEGAITIPAKKFFDILHSLPDKGDVELIVDSGGRIQLHCGRSRFGIVGAPKSEYPVLPEFNSSNAFEVDAEVIADMIRKTVFAASSDETRHALNGVFWSAQKGNLEMVATDGRRLSVISKKILPKEKDFQVIVPTKILSEFLRLFGVYDIKPESGEKVQVGVTENQIAFRMKQTTLLSRLISGNFPNYAQVIPSKINISVTLNTKDMLAVTRRAALCAIERGGSVKYTLNQGVLHVAASSQTLEFNDDIPVDYKGGEFSIAFNPQFMADALKHVDTDRVSLGFTTSVNPALLTPIDDGDYKFVVMPMRG